MNQSKFNFIVTVVAILVIAALGIFAILVDNADGCQPGKPCNNPLPTNSGKNGGPVACDPPGGGRGPEHKCNPTESPSTPTPVKVEPVEQTATPVKVEPTATPVKVEPVEPTATPVKVEPVEPTVEATVEVTATTTTTNTVGFPPATACGDTEVCNPCDLLLQALEEGLVVVITDKDNVTMIQDGSITVEGGLLATGKLSETR